MNLKEYFDRVVLINLRRRPDRLTQVTKSLQLCNWPFKQPEVFEAVDGLTESCPDSWLSGKGAWGCLCSHHRVLDLAIRDGVRNILVLEDDVRFSPGFRTEIGRFLRSVPNDWDQLMIGGQHSNKFGLPQLINPNVYKCSTCERTHCYAIRGDFMRKLRDRWLDGGTFNGKVHCDWIMARDPEMQLQHRVYSPTFFLAGQDCHLSDVTGVTRLTQFWNPPGPDLSVVHLQCTSALSEELCKYGFHYGTYMISKSTLDRAHSMIATGQRDQGLKEIADLIIQLQWEVTSNPHLICTIHHPEITVDMVREASLWKVYEARGDSVQDVLRQLPPKLRRSRRLLK